MSDTWKRAVRSAGLLILFLLGTALAGLLLVLGFREIPYLTLPALMALLVWGLFKVYNSLMRRAEIAYLEQRQARERQHARDVAKQELGYGGREGVQRPNEASNARSRHLADSGSLDDRDPEQRG